MIVDVCDDHISNSFKQTQSEWVGMLSSLSTHEYHIRGCMYVRLYVCFMDVCNSKSLQICAYVCVAVNGIANSIVYYVLHCSLTCKKFLFF